MEISGMEVYRDPHTGVPYRTQLCQKLPPARVPRIGNVWTDYGYVFVRVRNQAPRADDYGWGAIRDLKFSESQWLSDVMIARLCLEM